VRVDAPCIKITLHKTDGFTILQHAINEIHRMQKGFKQSFLAMLLQKVTVGQSSAVDGRWSRITAPCRHQNIHRSGFEAQGATVRAKSWRPPHLKPHAARGQQSLIIDVSRASAARVGDSDKNGKIAACISYSVLLHDILSVKLARTSTDEVLSQSHLQQSSCKTNIRYQAKNIMYAISEPDTPLPRPPTTGGQVQRVSRL
jgi:hypothetical protein